jgi:hypothetical protein
MTFSSEARREQLDVFERQRRALIADLVKVDFEIARLRARPPTALPSSEIVADSEHVFGD